MKRTSNKGHVFEAQCKDCNSKFFFTDTARTTDTARGLSPPERCTQCRKKNAADIRSVGVAYWTAPIETNDEKRCWGKFGLGRLVRHRDPPKKISYSGVPTDLPLRSFETLKTKEDQDLHTTFKTIAPATAELVKALEDPNGPRVAVMVGPTGTGKSTWVPYCLLQSKIGREGRICVTQPRTITLRQEKKDLGDDTTTPGFIAKRLLKAPQKGAGQEIGLLYRGESTQFDRYTKLLFATDGIIIRWLTTGEIAKFSVLMIDEAHEQSENMEQIFALLRYKLPQLPRLRVVIASATIASSKFQEFFGNGDPDSVPVFGPANAETHTNYEIHERWPSEYAKLINGFRLPRSARECPRASSQIVKSIRSTDGFTKLSKPKGDVLVFMPTARLVEDTVSEMRSLKLPDLAVFPCHAKWSEAESNAFYSSERSVKKMLAKQQNPEKQRVIVATTYAETSVTITNLRYVIDSGYVTSPRWDPATESTGVDADERHTRAGCIQRKGRVGRKQEGEWFPLYSKESFGDDGEFPEHPRPEVSRTSLDKFLLTAKICGVNDLSTYEWLGKKETPHAEIERASSVLQIKHAVDQDGDPTANGVVWEGVQAGSVALSIFMADSDLHACALEVATFVAFVNHGGAPFQKEEDGLIGFYRWKNACSDDLEFYLRIFHAWNQVEPKERRNWCKKNGLVFRAMRAIGEGVTRNLRQFSPRTRHRLEARVLDVEHLQRSRFVLAKCLYDSIFVSSEDQPLLFVPLSGDSDLTAQIDQESACAGQDELNAFICIDRRRNNRSVAKILARHVVKVEPSWTEELPTAGPLRTAQLIRRAVNAATPSGSIFTSPKKRNAPSKLKIGQARSLNLIREGRDSSGNSLILAADAESGEPMVLTPAKRLREIFPPGTTARGVVAEVGSKSGAVRLSQKGLIQEFFKNAGRELNARIVDVALDEAEEIKFVVVQIEMGVEGILFPEFSDLITWRSLSTTSIGKAIRVTVLPKKEQADSKSLDRPKIATLPFSNGRKDKVNDETPFGATIHSIKYDCGVVDRVRFEFKPGHIYTLVRNELPDNWKKVIGDWQPNQTCEVFLTNPKAKRVVPKQLMDQEFAPFSVNSRFNVTIVRTLPKCSFAHLTPRIDAMIPISEMSWARIDSAHDVAPEHSRVLAQVIDADPSTYRVVMSIKRTQPEPWSTAAIRYPVGSQVTGEVVRLKDFGAFVKVEDTIDGLVHVSELAWKRVNHPREILSVGSVVTCRVVGVNVKDRKMSLSTKQLLPDPWNSVVVGKTLHGIVKNIKDFGAFVEIADGVEGLVHISEMSNDYVSSPYDVVTVGQSVRVLVIDKPQRGKVSLSIRGAATQAASIPRPKIVRKPSAKSKSPVTRTHPSTSSSNDDSWLSKFKKWLGG